MDYTPHTHEVKLKFYQTSAFPRFAGQTEIQYGDTYVRIAATRRTDRWSPEKLEERVRRATLKAVEKHDRASARLAKPEATKQHGLKVVSELNKIVLARTSPSWNVQTRQEWGSGLLRKEVKNDV